MQTKKERAKELLHRAESGPAFSMTFVDLDLTWDERKLIEAEATRCYKLWSSTWLIPDLKRLVPQLKENHETRWL